MSAGLADVSLAILSGPKSQGLAAGLTLCALHYIFIALQHAFVCCMPSLGVSSLDLGPFFERPSFCVVSVRRTSAVNFIFDSHLRRALSSNAKF